MANHAKRGLSPGQVIVKLSPRKAFISCPFVKLVVSKTEKKYEKTVDSTPTTFDKHLELHIFNVAERIRGIEIVAK